MSIQSTGRSKYSALSVEREATALDLADPLALIHKRQLAKLLGVNPWTIDHWRKSGRLPAPLILSPQVVAWRRRDIERWLDERASHPAVTQSVKSRAARKRRVVLDQ